METSNASELNNARKYNLGKYNSDTVDRCEFCRRVDFEAKLLSL